MNSRIFCFCYLWHTWINSNSLRIFMSFFLFVCIVFSYLVSFSHNQWIVYTRAFCVLMANQVSASTNKEIRECERDIRTFTTEPRVVLARLFTLEFLTPRSMISYILVTTNFPHDFWFTLPLCFKEKLYRVKGPRRGSLLGIFSMLFQAKTDVSKDNKGSETTTTTHERKLISWHSQYWDSNRVSVAPETDCLAIFLLSIYCVKDLALKLCLF